MHLHSRLLHPWMNGVLWDDLARISAWADLQSFSHAFKQARARFCFSPTDEFVSRRSMPSQLASRKGSRAGPVALSLSDGTLVDRMIKFEPSMFQEMVRCLGEARHVPASPGKLRLTQHPAIQAAYVRGLVDQRHRSLYLRQSLVGIIYRVYFDSQFGSKVRAAKAHQKRRAQVLRSSVPTKSVGKTPGPPPPHIEEPVSKTSENTKRHNTHKHNN